MTPLLQIPYVAELKSFLHMHYLYTAGSVLNDLSMLNIGMQTTMLPNLCFDSNCRRIQLLHRFIQAYVYSRAVLQICHGHPSQQEQHLCGTNCAIDACGLLELKFTQPESDLLKQVPHSLSAGSIMLHIAWDTMEKKHLQYIY